MAAGLVIYRGSQLLGATGVVRYYNSGATLAKGDLVNLASGELDVAGAGERILGVAMGDATSSSTNVPVQVTPFMTVVMDNDENTFAATDVGKGFDITGGTGAQIVDTSTGADLTNTSNSTQLACLEYNPQGVGYDSDTSVGLFMIRENQLFGDA